jgi:hypothetical protein
MNHTGLSISAISKKDMEHARSRGEQEFS